MSLCLQTSDNMHPHALTHCVYLREQESGTVTRVHTHLTTKCVEKIDRRKIQGGVES